MMWKQIKKGLIVVLKRYGYVLLCKNQKKLETCTKEIPIHAFTCPNLIKKLSRNSRKKTILQVFWDLTQDILAILDQLGQGRFDKIYLLANFGKTYL